MPRRDKTGPEGEGPKTGRGLGNCKDVKEKDTKSTVVRRGEGRGQGNRRRGK